MNSNKYISNFLWRFAERWGAQGVTFIVSIVLARLLDPAVYGVVAIISAITSFLNIFVDSGFSSALIQKKNADELDFCTVFYFNLALCFVLYIGLFFAAPLIANFYESELLSPLIRVQGLSLIISGFKSIQITYVSKNMMFRKFFFATLGGTIGAAIVGISMAMAGFGVWALVAQDLFNSTLDTIILYLTVKWIPQRKFSLLRLKTLFLFGSRLLISSIIYNTYNDLRQLLIGKYYTSSDLALYNKGYQFPRLISININSALDSILFPAMAENQDSIQSIKSIVERTIKTSIFVVSPLSIGLAACAEPLVRILLTEKWLPCAYYMRIFCLGSLFGHIGQANLNALKALGEGKLLVKIEAFKTAIDLIILILSLQIGVKAIAYGVIVSQAVNMFICTVKSKRLLQFSVFNQLGVIFPNILLTLFMGLCVWSISLFAINDIVTLLIQIPLGILVYVGLAYIFKFQSLYYILNCIKIIFKIRETGKK